MPLIGFKCPSWTKTPGQPRLFVDGLPQDCFDCDKPCMDIALLILIAQDTVKNPHKGNIISATSLNATRSTFLERTVNYLEEPQDCWARTRGGNIHSNLETMIALHPNFEDFLCEYNVKYPVPGTTIELSMTVDRYQKSRKMLVDYKTQHDNAWKFMGDGAKPDHIMQTNIYRIGLESQGYEVKRIDINYISMKFTKEIWNC